MSIRGAIGATLAALGVLTAAPPGVSRAELLTVPLRDSMRSGSTPASASLSTDGRYLAFSSYDRLTPADTDERADIYLLDRSASVVTLLSATVDSTRIDSDCAQPRVSGDGRYVVFEATFERNNGDQIGPDVVMHDRVEGTTRRITRSVLGGLPNGWSASPAISADGRAVAFASTATDLVKIADANGSSSDIYLFHVATGTVDRVSLDSHGAQPPTGASVAPSVSADGRFIAFTSTSRFDGAPARQQPQARRQPLGRAMSYVYLRDTGLGLTTRVAPKHTEPDNVSMMPVVSADGGFVVFASLAANLVAGDRNRSSDVFLYERATGLTTLVSRSASGRSANGTSSSPTLSADGRVVAFQSDASDLACPDRCSAGSEDINLLSDVFVWDRRTGVNTRISDGLDGAWMEESGAPALDALGDTIAFVSKHPMDDRDVANDFDLFVRGSGLR
jgi:Tol biopolymer transport system component